jgi:predicted glycosyltransferase involved in capsule biosynthesis
MLTITIFTFKRIDLLNRCLESLDSKHISEILIFNDDETKELSVKNIYIDTNKVKIFNPNDFGYTNREFRKPIYLNKAVEICKNDFILFSDDDGVFDKGSIDAHFNALQNYHFSAGGISRSKLFKKISKSILQGTNYAFRKNFFKDLGGYDENFSKSMGGGDIDFWYRIFNYATSNNIPVAFLPTAKQKVTSKSTRKKLFRGMDPRKYTMKKHNLNLNGPMYKWFKNIRDKSNWMKIVP